MNCESHLRATVAVMICTFMVISAAAQPNPSSVSRTRAAIAQVNISAPTSRTTGACCDRSECLGTMTPLDCEMLGGTWHVGEDCDSYECPEPCVEDTLMVYILTDNYPSETTWDLYEQGGELITSSGQLSNVGTLYSWQVCLEYAKCYDFTIYDTYGDGICCSYGEGYYELYLNGVLVGSGGEFGYDETSQVGSACVEPTGACCIDMVCVATTIEADCDALGGIWYEGEICPDFVCPEPVGDDCEEPVVITGPYPVTVNGTNIGMTVDCPGLLDWNAQWFYFELPYAENGVTITLNSTTDLSTAGIIVMEDCACDDYIIGIYDFSDPSITIEWELTGPGYYYFPAYAVDADGNPVDYSVTFDVTDHTQCFIDCEENEGEGDCYEDYEDLYNGGCNSDGYPFQTLECGETICGTSGVYLYNGSAQLDMDWYQFTLDEPSIVTWTVQADFYASLWLLSGDCDNLTTEEHEYADECEQVTLTQVFEAGTYLAVVAPAISWDYECGVKYEATLTCEVLTGACCTNEGLDCVTNLESECEALGGEWYMYEDCDTFECPVPCDESQIDIMILTDNWGHETHWEITDHHTGEVVCEGGVGGIYEDNTLYHERCCIGYVDCVDFTIYDEYGDGVLAPGGYTLMLDGWVIADCMGEGWSGHSDDVENFGGGCVVHTGACCVDNNCVATNEENECDALGGRWYQDETCPAFMCPGPWGDYSVTAPFTSEVLTTCGRLDDCQPPSQSNNTEDVVFLVEIPYAGAWNFNTCLSESFDTWMAAGTDSCLEDLGYNDDSCDLQSEIIVYLEHGWYNVDIEGYVDCGEFVFDVHEELTCQLDCPDGADIESEACGDVVNDGCSMDIPAFEPIACDQTICGTAWFDGSLRDVDYYVFTAVVDDHMTMTVEAEFDVLLGVFEQYEPGQPGCNNLTGYLDPYQLLDDCEQGSVEFDVVAGGVYYLFVGPQFDDIFDCDDDTNLYIATLTGEYIPDPTGACCNGWECLGTVTESECQSLCGTWYPDEDCATFDCSGSPWQYQIAIDILTDDWGSETSWQITDIITGDVLCSGGDYDNNTLYHEYCCLGRFNCVDFTIYDAYGDGINPPGGFTIRHDGFMIYDCMGDGWSGSSETVESIGPYCGSQPTGACCVDGVCVGTVIELECINLGGVWYEDEDCFNFECPGCWDFEVTAPYVSEPMSTCGLGDDCSPPGQPYDTEDVVFKVEIPYDGMWSFNTCRGYGSGFDTWIALGSDCCLTDLGYNDDACGQQSEIQVYIEAGTYYVDIEGYNACGEFVFAVNNDCGCQLICPEDGIEENEDCGGDSNDGCDLAVPAFESIACNETICGTAWFTGTQWDTDWYEYIATVDDHMTLTVESQFGAIFGLMEQIEPGVPGCGNLTGEVEPSQYCSLHNEATIEFDVEAGGVYYLFIAPQPDRVFGCNDSEIMYIALLTGDNCICGDFDQSGVVDVDDFYILIDSFGKCTGDAGYEDACDFDDDACITLIDYQMWMECYREANGKRFIPPPDANEAGRNSGGQAHPSGF